MTQRPIKRALLSVFDKTNLLNLAQFLVDRGVEIYSTGGTAQTLTQAGITVISLEEYTGFPEILSGRVKSLHPRIHAGLLARQNNPSDLAQLQTHGIATIDLAVITLYPFAETITQTADYQTAIEMIDIGGCTLIRAAAKNHAFVTVIVDPDDYSSLKEEISQNNATSLQFRAHLAQKAFTQCALYDAQIADWMAKTSDPQNPLPPLRVLPLRKYATLRYGENPHQHAALYTHAQPSTRQIQGKPLSYNNIQDTDAAYRLINEFDKPAVAFIKHGNPCGVAQNDVLSNAYQDALACDSVSAYGGIMACNRVLTQDIATEIKKLFLEAIIVPDIDPQANQLLASRTALRILVAPLTRDPGLSLRTVRDGVLIQTPDTAPFETDKFRVVSEREPTPQEWNDLLFAFKVVRHIASNAIVFVKDQKTVGIGAGQMSRVDSVRLAVMKKSDPDLPCVMASDAFFPFSDGVLTAAKAGVTAIIQSGGSIRDQDVIKTADHHRLAMILTGSRHFRH